MDTIPYLLQTIIATDPLVTTARRMSMLKKDLSFTYNRMKGSRFTKILKLWLTPGVRAVIVFRFGNWLLTQPSYVRFCLKLFYIFLQRRMMSKWGIELNAGATIGGGLRIAHYGGIFVGDDVVIGENCIISHDVTIGLSGSGARRGAPVIGDNVYIAPGAKIVGKIRIGHNAQIGTNAFVYRNVPDNALVQVSPVQIVVIPSYGARQVPQQPDDQQGVKPDSNLKDQLE